jgi:hypothetical protein
VVYLSFPLGSLSVTPICNTFEHMMNYPVRNVL